MQKFSQKTNTIIGFFVLILLIIAFCFFFFQKEEKESVASRAEAEILAEESQTFLMEAEKEEIDEVLPAQSDDHMLGKVSAPISLLVYGDLDCPFCVNFYETILKIRRDFPEDVAIVWRHYPMTSHERSFELAEIFECLVDTGADLNLILEENFVNNNIVGKNSEELSQIFSVNSDDLEKCFLERKFKNKIELEKEIAEESGVIGTPTIFLNKRILSGAIPYDDFLDQQGERQSGLRTLILAEIEK